MREQPNKTTLLWGNALRNYFKNGNSSAGKQLWDPALGGQSASTIGFVGTERIFGHSVKKYAAFLRGSAATGYKFVGRGRWITRQSDYSYRRISILQNRPSMVTAHTCAMLSNPDCGAPYKHKTSPPSEKKCLSRMTMQRYNNNHVCEKTLFWCFETPNDPKRCRLRLFRMSFA